MADDNPQCVCAHRKSRHDRWNAATSSWECKQCECSGFFKRVESDTSAIGEDANTRTDHQWPEGGG